MLFLLIFIISKFIKKHMKSQKYTFILLQLLHLFSPPLPLLFPFSLPTSFSTPTIFSSRLHPYPYPGSKTLHQSPNFFRHLCRNPLLVHLLLLQPPPLSWLRLLFMPLPWPFSLPASFSTPAEF